MKACGNILTTKNIKDKDCLPLVAVVFSFLVVLSAVEPQFLVVMLYRVHLVSFEIQLHFRVVLYPESAFN